MIAENYFSDFRDAFLYVDCAMLDKPYIPPQPKLYLADQRHYFDRLQNIPFPLEQVGAIAIWRTVMDENVSSS